MSALPVPSSESQITSAIHLEFIRSVADSGDPAGAEAVEAFHRALFLNQHGSDLERFAQDRRTCEERLVRLDSQLRHVDERLDGELKFVPPVEGDDVDDEPNAPWNGWDRTMFVAAILGILGLLVFGVLNVSFNLLESGIVTFAEHPTRAYLWAALLPVGALAVKIGWDSLRRERGRDVYLWTCLGIGVFGVLVWVAAYAAVYPSLSRTPLEQLGSLDVFAGPTTAPAADGGGSFLNRTTAGGVKVLDMILVAAQAIAEIFLSAALGIFLTRLYGRHRPVRLAANPIFVQFDSERRFLEAEVSRERRTLAEAIGNHNRLEHQLSVFLAYARSLYRKETTERHNRAHRQRRLIEEIADELRSRLDALDHEPERSGGNGESTAFHPTPSATR